MRKNQKKGFTLVEIIVVIVILAVLMAVAVPSVLKYIHEADDAKYMAQGHTVLSIAQTEVLKAYADDNVIDDSEEEIFADGNIYGSGTNGMGDISFIQIIMSVNYEDPNSDIEQNVTVTENDDVITIEGYKNEKRAPAKIVELPEIAFIYAYIDNKNIVVVPNDKVYISDKPLVLK